MKLINTENRSVVAGNLRRADTFWRRLRGLSFTRRLPEGDALLISPCHSVHTCFMRYPIDILFLNDEFRVVGCCCGLRPYRLSPIFRGAKHVVELPAGSIAKLGIRDGHILAIQ